MTEQEKFAADVDNAAKEGIAVRYNPIDNFASANVVVEQALRAIPSNCSSSIVGNIELTEEGKSLLLRAGHDASVSRCVSSPDEMKQISTSLKQGEVQQLIVAVTNGLPIWPTSWSQDVAFLAFTIHNLEKQAMVSANRLKPEYKEFVKTACEQGLAPWYNFGDFDTTISDYKSTIKPLCPASAGGNIDPDFEDALDRIRKWPISENYKPLFDYIISNAWKHDFGKATAYDDEYGQIEYTFVTGGWSENEEIISALKEQRLAWALTWQRSERGGKHVFVAKA